MAGVDSRCRVTITRVARETVTLPTVWQGATVFPNTRDERSNSDNEQEQQQPAVDSINHKLCRIVVELESIDVHQNHVENILRP